MKNTLPNTTVIDIVKPMTRGQVTLPIKIREQLNITSNTWLWVRVVDNKVVLEPVNQPQNQTDLIQAVQALARLEQPLWRETDEEVRQKTRRKSIKRLKKIT